MSSFSRRRSSTAQLHLFKPSPQPLPTTIDRSDSEHTVRLHSIQSACVEATERRLRVAREFEKKRYWRGSDSPLQSMLGDYRGTAR
jgi:hypothetical protein